MSCELQAESLSKIIIMTNSEQKLRKANKELKDEVAELKMKLEKVLKEVTLERKKLHILDCQLMKICHGRLIFTLS